MLSNDQIEKYHRDGYVTPDFRLADDVLDDIRGAHSRLVARHPEFSDYCSAVLAYDTSYLNIARRSDILDMVGQILGDNIALWNSSFFAKPARVGTKTVWIAVDAATRENGCLRVIPGSHRSQSLAQHHENNADGLALNLELNPDQFDESQAEDIILEPGQVSLHDVYLYHGSEANTSEHPRRGMTLRYMPTSSVYEHESSTRFAREGKLHMSQRTVYLMRGIDQSGKNDFRVRY